MNEGIVEGGKDAGDAENEFTCFPIKLVCPFRAPRLRNSGAVADLPSLT